MGHLRKNAELGKGKRTITKVMKGMKCFQYKEHLSKLEVFTKEMARGREN